LTQPQPWWLEACWKAGVLQGLGFDVLFLQPPLLFPFCKYVATIQTSGQNKALGNIVAMVLKIKILETYKIKEIKPDEHEYVPAGCNSKGDVSHAPLSTRGWTCNFIM
jgi:hypothetical protein